MSETYANESGEPVLPGWQEFLRPMLTVLSDGEQWQTRALSNAVAERMGLDTDQLEVLNASGQTKAYNRAQWARHYLKRAGALESVRTGYARITAVGDELVASAPEPLDLSALRALPSFDQGDADQSDALFVTAEAERPVWFVGAYVNGSRAGDHTERFVRDGIWENGSPERDGELVRSMETGDKIAIKAAYVRKRGTPFPTHGNTVSVMPIKATGTIVANHGDGRTIEVDWQLSAEPREWYFYTYRSTVWRVWPGDWRADGLIAFAFGGEDQDIDAFRNAPYWRERFGDGAGPELAGPSDDADAGEAAWTTGGDDLELAEEDAEPENGYGIESIVEDGCFIPADDLTGYLEIFRRRKNLILQGPPGTGKTWLARRLGQALIGSKDRRLLRAIQFHPSTSYEDFVRGWRPSSEGKLQMSDGVFLEMISDAKDDPGNNYVLVIEEINRADLAQVFGEMLTLLEADKRKPREALDLTYMRHGEEPVFIPENLYVIGTMNLADRSLAIVDFALRRRFAFVDLEPMLNGLWRTWVSDRNGIPERFLAALAERVNELNGVIADEPSLGSQYRVGHSFVTPSDGGAIEDPSAWLENKVDKEIRPLLEEYWFDDPRRAGDEAERLLPVRGDGF